MYAADVDCGYGTTVLQSLNEAVRYGMAALYEEGLQDLLVRFGSVISALGWATRAVRGEP